MLNPFPHITHHQISDHSLEIVRTARKDSLALKIRADQVVILVPKHYSNRRLNKVLVANHKWLLKGASKLQERLKSQEYLVGFQGKCGETFDFLGTPVTLVLYSQTSEAKGEGGEKNITSIPNVSLQNAKCLITGVLLSPSIVLQAVEIFMIQTAQDYLSSKLAHYAQQIGVSYSIVTVKGYKSRWGSCHSDGRLQFNWRLWQAPEWVIDYVIVHELCHRIYPNHSKAFWELVMQHYPKTNEARQVIKQQGERWIRFLGI